MPCRNPISKLTVTYNLTHKIQPASFDTPAPVPSVVPGNSFTLLLSNTSWCGCQAWFWSCLRTILLNLILYTGTVLRPSGNTVIFFGSNSFIYNHIRHLSRFMRLLTLLLKNTLSCPLLTWIDCTRFVIQCFWVLFLNLPCTETSKQENGRTNLLFW